ncbi:MAG TPA: histidine kinase [Actinocrinis sp.]|nr:histidine kinase [Actinocrinis sp.]
MERDLHDGAQARLVAMGMNLGAAEALLDEHPEAARTLLAEAREASAKALTELRGLVRGIHPPVLADRGLGDAVRAIALDSPLTTQVTVDLPGRLEPAVDRLAQCRVRRAEMLLPRSLRRAAPRTTSPRTASTPRPRRSRDDARAGYGQFRALSNRSPVRRARSSAARCRSRDGLGRHAANPD